MKHSNVYLVTILLSVGFLAVAAGQSAGAQGARNYDPRAEVRVKGVVQEVQQLMRGMRCCTGTHLLLKTDTETLDVHVGPSSFVQQSQFSFANGDEVEVLGSKVTMAGKEILLAREITKGEKTLVLRDAQGIPMWSRGRR
jgi:hypothetical protein